MFTPNVRNYLVGGATVSSLQADITLTVLRVATGLSLAFAHGMKKMPPPDGFIQMVGSMGFPAPELFAWLAGLAELVGGVLLAIGLLTRPAATFIFVTMSVAFFVAHKSDPFATKELALLMGCCALAFIGLGAGRISVDHVIR